MILPNMPLDITVVLDGFVDEFRVFSNETLALDFINDAKYGAQEHGMLTEIYVIESDTYNNVTDHLPFLTIND